MGKSSNTKNYTATIALLAVLCVFPYAVHAQSWEELAVIPTPRVDASIALASGQIFVVGGVRGDRQPVALVERFDLATNSWLAESNQLNAARTNAAITRVGQTVVVSGGLGGDGKALSSVELFNPSTGTWRNLDELNVPRFGHAMTVFKGSLYALGGSNADGSIVGSVEVFENNEWTLLPDVELPFPVAGLGAVSTENEMVLIGGVEALGPTEKVQVIDFSDSPTIVAPLPEPRSGFATIRVGRNIFVVGGRTASNDVLRSVLRYDFENITWVDAGELRRARAGLAAVVTDQQLIVAGGRDRTGQVIRSIVSTPLQFIVSTVPQDVPSVTESIEVYPNPAREEVRLVLVNAPAISVETTLFDALGRNVRNLDVSTERETIILKRYTTDGSRLPRGVYFARLRMGNAYSTVSIVFN